MSLEQTVKYGNYKSMVYNVRYERICKQKNSMAFLKSFIKGQTPKWLRRKISITVISKNSISICDSKNSDRTTMTAKICWKHSKMIDMIDLMTTIFAVILMC